MHPLKRTQSTELKKALGMGTMSSIPAGGFGVLPPPPGSMPFPGGGGGGLGGDGFGSFNIPGVPVMPAMAPLPQGMGGLPVMPPLPGMPA